jgi:hypothetical protein
MADMEKHRDFVKWAISNGVEVNGVVPHRFPGRGLGIIAEQSHKVGCIFYSGPMPFSGWAWRPSRYGSSA